MFLMRQSCRVVVVAGLLFIVGAAAAQTPDHGQPGPDWIPKTKVKKILIKAGYSQITDIHAQDGAWRGRGIENGATYRFRVDPHTGEVSQTKLSSKPGAN